MNKKKLTAVLLIAVVAVVIAAAVIAALTLQKRQMLISVTAETRDKTMLDLGKWHGRFLTTEIVYTAVIYDIDKFEDAFKKSDRYIEELSFTEDDGTRLYYTVYGNHAFLLRIKGTKIYFAPMETINKRAGGGYYVADVFPEMTRMPGWYSEFEWQSGKVKMADILFLYSLLPDEVYEVRGEELYLRVFEKTDGGGYAASDETFVKIGEDGDGRIRAVYVSEND